MLEKTRTDNPKPTRYTHAHLFVVTAGSSGHLLEFINGLEPVLDLLPLGLGHHVHDLLRGGGVEHARHTRHVLLTLFHQRRQLPVNLPEHSPAMKSHSCQLASKNLSLSLYRGSAF